MLRRTSIALVVLCLASSVTRAIRADEAVPKLETGRPLSRSYYFKEAEKDVPYSLYVPRSYDPDTPTPLVVALHGLYSNPGQIVGYPGFVQNAERHGYAIVAPMGYNRRGWYGSRGKGGGRRSDPDNLGELSEQDVLNVLGLVRDELNVDPERIHLFGHSMGGGGGLHLAMKYPDLWASMALVAPAAPRNIRDLAKAKRIGMLVVQGERDRLVPAWGTRRWVREMQRIGLPHRYIEDAGGGHVFVAFRHFPEIFAFFDSHTRTRAPWPGFRGPNGDGVAADDPRLPTSWSKTENVAWTADVPGWGWSNPVVWGNRVFLTTVVSDEETTEPKKGLYLGQGVRAPAKGEHHWLVLCYDLHTGEELWRHEAHVGQPAVPRHPKATYANETPVTDGERLYVLFGDVGLFCYDLDGKPLWDKSIEPRKTFLDYGAAASPVVHGNQVFVLYDNAEESFLAAFDVKSGKQNWRTKRNESSTWATPYVWAHGARTEIVTCGKARNRSYDLEGNLLWEFDGKMSNLVIPSPFATNGLLYVSSGYIGDKHRPVYAVRPGAEGDISLAKDETSNEHIAWYRPKASSYNPSPIVYNGRYYTVYDRGILTCQNAETGEDVFERTRIGGGGASFTASPWAYNGKLFALSEDGVTYVMKDGSTFEPLGENDLGELCLASPAISDGRLLIRTASKLYCLTNAADATSNDGTEGE